MQKSFQTWLQPSFGAFRLDYNADRLKALASERAAEWERVGKAAFLTLDEQREALGYGPAPKEALFAKRDVGLERRYSPDQPRVPAGRFGAGRWTSGGGGGDSGGAIAGSDLEEIAANFDRDAGRGLDSHIERVQESRFRVDLAEEEAQGGHAIAKHVGRSKEQLRKQADRNRIGLGKYGIWEDRVGSFSNIHAANSLVNEVLTRSASTVDEVIAGKKGYALLSAWFDRPTGYESYRKRFHDKVIIRDTVGVTVIIRRAPKLSKGYSILTAYPANP